MSGSRVLIADDHPLTLEGMSLAARAALPGGSIVAVGSIAAAAAALEGRGGFRLVLLDFHLPDSHGFSGLLKLQHLAPATPIVMVTAREEPTLVEAARALGAAAYLFKSRPLDEIAAILRRVLAGGTHFPAHAPPSPGVTAARARIADLSRAQHSVLIALADGRSNKQIASELAVTEATIKAHLTAIFRKMGVANRTQALLAVQPLFQAGAGAG